MSGRGGARPDEGLMMMQELEDKLKEHIDKLEHVRLGALELKDCLAAVGLAHLAQGDESGPFVLEHTNNADLKQSVSEHLDWLNRMTERVEMLQMNTAVFVQMNTKPRTWGGKQGRRRSSSWARQHLADDARSELGWSPVRTRRNSDAASEVSCAW